MQNDLTNQPQTNLPTQQPPTPPVVEEIYNLNEITNDLFSAKIISPAYAGRNSELTAILNYNFQSLIFDGLGRKDIAETLTRISIDEMRHLELLGKTLYRLGVTPIYTAFPPLRDMYFTTRYINYITDPVLIIKLDIAGEQNAILSYERMLTKLTNHQVKLVIESILISERRHVQMLTEILNKLV